MNSRDILLVWKMASSEGSHGRNNETVFNVIDSDKDSLKEAHDALNQRK